MKKNQILAAFLLVVCVGFSQTRIKMQQEDGIYTIPCTVNGLRLRFVFDTGASNVCISLAEATFMLKNGYLEPNDIIGKSKSIIADGSLVENTHINLREIEISGMKLTNIDAVVMNNISAPLLLGQSAIQKLGKIQLEGEDLLIINYDNLYLEEENAMQLLREASDLLEKKLYLMASERFKQAYKIEPNIFRFWDYIDYGFCCYMLYDNDNAIKLLSIANSIKQDINKDNWKSIQYMYDLFCSVYISTEQYDKALIYIEEAINLSNVYIKNLKNCKELAGLYKRKGDVYFYKNSKTVAKSVYIEAFELWGKCELGEFVEERATTFFNDIDKGKIKDKWLGELMWRIGLCYDNIDDAARFIKSASKLGNQDAKEFVQNSKGYIKDYFDK